MKTVTMLMVAFAIATSLRAAEPAPDIVGKWTWSLPSAGAAPVEVSLTIEPGEGLHAASYVETGKAPIPVTVHVTGRSVSFTVAGSGLGEEVQYIGRLVEDDTIDGLIKRVQRREELGEGLAWKATRPQI